MNEKFYYHKFCRVGIHHLSVPWGEGGVAGPNNDSLARTCSVNTIYLVIEDTWSKNFERLCK